MERKQKNAEQGKGPKITQNFRGCTNIQSGNDNVMTVSKGMASLSLRSNEEQAGEDYQRAIRKAWTQLIDNMQTDILLDKFTAKDFLEQRIVNDIWDETKRSEKNRTILEHVLSSGPEKYKDFKKCLISSRQEHLVQVLEDKEKEVADEKCYPGVEKEVADEKCYPGVEKEVADENCNPDLEIDQEVNASIESSEEEADETMPDHQSSSVSQDFDRCENIQVGDNNVMKVSSSKKK